MITIFKNKKDIPQDKEYVELNDVYFNQNTAMRLDERANEIIEKMQRRSDKYEMLRFSTIYKKKKERTCMKKVKRGMHDKK